MKLAGIELHNFRSIGNEPVVLKPWRKCNILIGQNNAGKSNVIRAVQRISDRLKGEGSLLDLDFHRRSPENDFRFRLYFEGDVSEDEELANLAGATVYYFDLSWQSGDPTVTDHSFVHIENFRLTNKLIEYLAGVRFGQRLGANSIRKELLRRKDSIWGRFRGIVPAVHIIPEFRQIQSGNVYTLDGANLIELLASYQHPEDGKDQNRDKFDRIEEFVRRLLHLPKAVLEVTHDKTTIMLKTNGLRLPLASYGTGVHELIILVTAVLSIENAICCIEEPEIHLHPRLQREFINFIATKTENQYLISTHSPTFINAIDAPDSVQVFHLRLENGATVGGPVLGDEDGLRALHDLGVKASDILQSNCILWVEGPSDRVYLKRWLDLIAPELVEGQDYSIMFYGGRLLSHLYADRDKVPDELIRVLKINQNAVVVMDSDRKQTRAHINKTKQRVREECERSGGICWVTDGREIENYLPERVIIATCEELVGKQIKISIGQYDKFEDVLNQALKTAGAKSLNYAGNKVKYARKIVQHFVIEDMENPLRKHVEMIVAKIKSWNE